MKKKNKKTPGGNLSDARISQEEYEDTLIRMAFMELAEREAMEGDPDEDELPEGIDFKAAEKRHLRLMRRELRRMNFGSDLKRGLRITGKVAVYALAAMFVVTASTLAISREARKVLYRYLIDLEKGYIRVSANVNVPEGWHGNYFPNYIPEGYKINKIFSDVNINYIEYLNSNDMELRFSELNSSVVSKINTGDGEISYAYLNDITVYQVVQDDLITLSWVYEDKYFILDYRGEINEAMRIAESVMSVYF